MLIGCFLIFFINQPLQAQDLETYLQMASENNPKVKASYAEFEAAMQRAPQVATLPDPTLTMSAFGRMIETRLGAQEARFNLMQMFPWFGTLRAKEDAANLMAEASFQNYLDLRNQVFFDVKQVYAELYALEKTIQLKKENFSILDSYRELALSRFRSGSSPMVNVVKVDIQRDAAMIEIELLEEKRKPLETRFNLMLRREKGEAIVLQDSILPENALAFNETDENFDGHPRLTGLEKQKEAYEMQDIIAQKEGNPMVGLGIDYSIISKRTDANPDMNGRDAIMPMVSVTLPIFRKKINAARKEAQLMGESILEQQEAQRNELQNEYEAALYELNSARKLLDLYDRQIASSGQANKLLISGYSNSITDFDEVLQMNQDVLMYQTQRIEALKNGLIAQAKLDYLMVR
ncbi:TolC family protein [Gillisia xinjiangensis]|uniref:TolC family protein n=1 Tax=Gillisia xinjiangensis TaxID=3384765 RepID=UPI003919ECBD